jgi:hypothetical protein
LEGTDWVVKSDFLVETETENLVYITLPADTKYYQIYDQKDKTNGVSFSDDEFTLTQPTTVLAFYSSCRNKPRYFQFIMLKNYDRENVKRDIERIILEPDCQCAIKPLIESNYELNNSMGYEMYLPTGATISSYVSSVPEG